MKTGRNDPCPCGSGKKYKQCCQPKEAAPQSLSVRALDIPYTLQTAADHQQAGRLREAVACAEQILQIEPNHAEALHLLGIVAHQLGKSELATELIDKASKAAPNNALFYSNGGNILYAQGRFAEAAARFRQALAIQPTSAGTHYDLGIALQAQGKQDEAAESYRLALRCDPSYAKAHNNLGTLLKDLGDANAAADHYRQAIRLNPNFAEAHCNLANIAMEQEHLGAAIAGYREAIRLKPDFAEAHHSLGMVLEQQGALEAAIASYRKTLALVPGNANAHFNLGHACQAQGQVAAAIASYCDALKRKPELSEARINVAILLQNLGRQTDAIAWLEQTLAAYPQGNWQIASLLMTAYWIGAKHDDAKILIRHYKETIEALDPARLERSDRGSLIFFLLIATLVNNLEKQSGMYSPAPDANALHAFGESHCLIPANAVFQWCGSQTKAQSHLVRGIKMHHLANAESNQYKACLTAQLESTPEASHLLFTIGEIDCRSDEGIWRNAQKGDQSLEELIANTVAGYLDWLAGQLGERKFLSVTIQGIPAPGYSLEGLLDMAKRPAFLAMIRDVNLSLKQGVAQHGWRFLDVHAATAAEDGATNRIWHLDSHHVQPRFYAEAESWIR